MDATSPDRVVIVIVAALCIVAAFAVLFWLGERREKMREDRAAKIRAGERAFQTEQFGRVVTAIHGENVLRIAAEEARLYSRTTRASE